MKNKRIKYFILLLVTVCLGLSSRSYPDLFPAFLAKYLGDTLWASMVYWGICLLFPSLKAAKAALSALAFSYCIEISQLYQADWINAIRNNRIGALVLGHGFLWSDIVCYTAGVLIAVFIDLLVIRKVKW